MPVWLRTIISVCIVVVFSAFFYWFFVRPYAYRWKPCEGRKGYGVCMPFGYNVHGIDISHHQGSVDWMQLISHKTSDFPLHFVFMKATEGGDHSDDAFPFNFDQARRYGFIRGAYHFFSPKTDPNKQADFFIRTVQLTAGDLPPVLDVENIGKSTPEDLKVAVKTWLDRIEEHYGVKPILYTSYKFKTRYLNDSIFNAYPYWIAHYYVDSVKYEGAWRFWQHTDAGRVTGINEEVDLNVFNGTLDELLGMTLR
ncbi:glycoside hydrolase family 25 protein [uncultured Bacteroides sp.]|uniref:glycoside hydrolase family 25 protein n=1 Tax=uncultured Bacteroides sp. TaxID=162156 RepID=UPI0025F2A239|nr:glycoside hydrolase family 25 protein [uncultured Bacteroides sp.]